MIDTTCLEEAIIGCILMNGDLFIPLKGELSCEDFRNGICKEIFKVMTILEYKGLYIDPVMVVTYLDNVDKIPIVSQGDVYRLANESPGEKLFEQYVMELGEIRGEEFKEQNK